MALAREAAGLIFGGEANPPHPGGDAVRKESMARKLTRTHDVRGRGPGHEDTSPWAAEPWNDGPVRPGSRARSEVEFDEPGALGAVFGQFDANLVLIENRLGVFISARGNRVQIEGSADGVARAPK